MTRGNQLPLRFANISDSGCSDTDDLSDIMGYDDDDDDVKERNGFVDAAQENAQEEEEEEQVFELEINSELDLEQIEKD